MRNSCIIDNWSLETTAVLLNGNLIDDDNYYNGSLREKIEYKNNTSLINGLNALTNILSGLIFYDKISYIPTGNEIGWKLKPYFSNKIGKYLQAEYVSENFLLENYNFSNSNKGSDFYIVLSKKMNSDLFLSPQRAAVINDQFRNDSFNIGNVAIDAIKMIDRELFELGKKTKSDLIKAELKKNYIIPSLTQFVLSESSSTNDILDIGIQLRESPEIKKLKEVIYEILTNSNQDIYDFHNRIRNSCKKTFKKLNIIDSKDRNFSAGLNAFILNLSYSFEFNLHKSEKYLMLYKNIAKSRIELNSLIENVYKLFKYRIDIEKFYS